MIGIDDAIAAVSGVVGKVIDRAWPDATEAAKAKLAFETIQADGSLKEYLADTELVKAQLAVNQAEASNPHIFVAGWRPFIGWVGGFALAFQFIVAPLLTWTAALFHSTAAPPSLDISQLLTLVFGMLGLAGMRTKEKLAGVETSALS